MSLCRTLCLVLLPALVLHETAWCEEPLDGEAGRPLAMNLFRPRSQLEVPHTDLRRARFPVVDVHTHPRYKFRHSAELLDRFVEEMDRQNIALCVSLDGRLGDEFLAHREYLWAKYRDRFVIFANIDWRGNGIEEDPSTWACNQPGFGAQMAAALEQAHEYGASGLKLFKSFGLEYKNRDGSLVRIDDRRWDPIWQACGEFGLPVLIHSADPVAFFEPIDRYNERWEELQRHSDWSFAGDEFPSHDELLEQRNRVMERHPQTTFIGAHVGNYPENLARVAEWLDRYPNFNVEIAARIGELGRQPYTAREFLIKYADRVMFGTDGPRSATRLHLHWRFLETRDEYFPYSEYEFPPQGFWNIYGVDLPDEVLGKIYSGNAARIVPGVAERLKEYAGS